MVVMWFPWSINRGVQGCGERALGPSQEIRRDSPPRLDERWNLQEHAARGFSRSFVVRCDHDVASYSMTKAYELTHCLTRLRNQVALIQKLKE